MTAHRYDVLISAQIVAKAIFDADPGRGGRCRFGMTGGDLRAAERTCQLLHQVAAAPAGPSGRAGSPADRAAGAPVMRAGPTGQARG